MRRTSLTPALVAGLALSTLAFAPVSGAKAQASSSQTDSEPESQATPAPLLSGPRVEPSAEGDSAAGLPMAMVNQLGKPEIPIAELAIDALKLTPDQRERVDRVLDARAAFMDRFVRENRETFELLKAARDERDRKTLRELSSKLRSQIEPELKEGTLEDRIARVIPEDQVETYRETIRQYTEGMQIVREANRKGDADPFGPAEMQDDDFQLFDDEAMAPARKTRAREPGDRPQTDRRLRRMAPSDRPTDSMTNRDPAPGRNEMIERYRNSPQAKLQSKLRAEATSILMVEAPRALQRVFAQKTTLADRIAEVITLKPEQEAKIRDTVRAFAEENGPDATPEQRQALIREVAQQLSPQQRAELRKAFRSGAVPTP